MGRGAFNEVVYPFVRDWIAVPGFGLFILIIVHNVTTFHVMSTSVVGAVLATYAMGLFGAYISDLRYEDWHTNGGSYTKVIFYLCKFLQFFVVGGSAVMIALLAANSSLSEEGRPRILQELPAFAVCSALAATALILSSMVVANAYRSYK